MLLALMPQQSPPATFHHMPMAMANTMSLAILPSSPVVYTSGHSHPPSPSKRPKLSLNTSNVPLLFGKKNTSLRVEALSAASPTTLNTFSNASLNPQQPSSIRKPALSALATDIQRDREQSPTDTATSHDSASSVSTIESTSGEAPYTLSHSLTSILSNGPIPRSRPQITSFSQAKPMMFPPTKRVSFRSPLEEEVKTSKYTMRHVDIESSTSTISTLELSPSKDDTQPHDSATEEDQKPSKRGVDTGKKSLSSSHIGEKRESSDEEEDSDAPAATPIAGRRKRSRHWVWTLPPVSSSTQNTPEKTSSAQKKLEETRKGEDETART